MTEFLADYGLFFAKSITLVVAALLLIGGILAMARASRGPLSHERLEVKNVNRRFERLGDLLNAELLPPHERKRLRKERQAQDKARRKAEKSGAHPPRPRVFALDFRGDLRATAVDGLREEISALLQVTRKDDEVLLRLESEGGLVHGYGLAASQLARVRDRGVRLTAAVDKVAASGGYMMACVADRIIAAPFAILGSIGVVAQLPNFHRLLRKHDIDFELHTAGPYKRTLTLFGENSEAAREKFREELEDTHALFKSFVAQNRPVVDIDRVATGEHWFGARAIALKLVDELKTSDDYLLERARDADIYELRYRRRQSLSERLAHGLTRLGAALRNSAHDAWSRA